MTVSKSHKFCDSDSAGKALIFDGKVMNGNSVQSKWLPIGKHVLVRKVVTPLLQYNSTVQRGALTLKGLPWKVTEQ